MTLLDSGDSDSGTWKIILQNLFFLNQKGRYKLELNMFNLADTDQIFATRPRGMKIFIA